MRKRTKSVYGVGINDADYEIYRAEKVNGKWKIVWMCPYFERWKGVLRRCYSKKIQEKHPTYKGCTVCEGWLLFSNFKKWMENQEWEGKQLDKDFLVDGNKVYSPTTCVFMSQKLNKFILTRAAGRGQYPLGVYYMKKDKKMVSELSKPYRSVISDQTGKQILLGVYAIPEEAHQVYLTAKLKQCQDYLIEYKNENLLVKGLVRIKDKIEYHINNKSELISY